jgi:hypothetical protein
MMNRIYEKDQIGACFRFYIFGRRQRFPAKQAEKTRRFFSALAANRDFTDRSGGTRNRLSINYLQIFRASEAIDAYIDRE